MRVIKITSAHDETAAVARLRVAGVEPLGACSLDGEPHLLVADAAAAIEILNRHGITAIDVAVPLPLTDSGIRWWKCWRDALPADVYFEFRCLHHEKVKSRGSLVRVRPAPDGAEPWRVLADGGVDIRCEFHCSLPTGSEVHVLVPDGDQATAVLERAGISACAMDYRGPRIEQGISWWGEWKPALAYAVRVQRPIVMSFASPRVEHVPGVW